MTLIVRTVSKIPQVQLHSDRQTIGHLPRQMMLYHKHPQTIERTMSRYIRASARLARCLWELSTSVKIRLTDIYRQMAFGYQTDKEFAFQGSKWKRYVAADRINHLMLNKEVVSKISEQGFIERLMPERRFDQTLYFTAMK